MLAFFRRRNLNIYRLRFNCVSSSKDKLLDGIAFDQVEKS